MTPLFRFSALIIMLIMVLKVQAQEQFFNSLLQKENIYDYFKTEFDDIVELDVHHNIYYRNDSRVVEFFDRESNEFLGLLVDIEKNPIHSLEFVKNQPKLKSLLVKNPPDLAMALYSSKPVIGMNMSQVEDLLGKPDKMKYSIKDNQQVLKYVYEDGETLYFLDGKITQNLDLD